MQICPYGEMNGEDRKKKLEEYKRSKKEDLLHMLPVYQENQLLAYLRPITFDYKASLPGIVNALSRWRRENPTAGAGNFEVTDERTENWLKKYVLKNENRIIFIIMDLENHYIGQIGLADFDHITQSADIDAVLRGEKDTLPGIMGAALHTIIKWGKKELLLRHIFLKVFDDNLHAIEFYKKNCFDEVNRIALVQVKYDAEIKWEEDEKMNPVLAKRCYVRMEYTEEEDEV